MDDKIDIHKHNEQLERLKKKIAKNTEINAENKDTILRYLRESELGKTILKGQKKKISAGRNIRTAGILLRLDARFMKPFEQITEQEMEDFILAMEKGKMLNAYGTPYKSETQKTIKKFIRKFWKWLKGNNERYPLEVSWIDTSGKDAEIKSINRKEVERMVDLARDIRTKAVIMTLFDGGLREGELLNIRVKDVTKEKDGKDYCYYVNIRHSKTKPRKISLKIATPFIEKWLGQYEQDDRFSAEAQLFPFERSFLYKTIKNIALAALKKPVSVQMMRHSSATHYASLIDNRASFCYRYGWSYSSKMPDRYIDWSKIYEKDTVEKIKVDEVSDIKNENVALKESLHLLREQMENISEELSERRSVDKFLNRLLEDKEIKKVLKEKLLTV